MTPEQREELKRAAMNATPGRWHSNGTLVFLPKNAGGLNLCHAPNAYANATHIALANPAAILSLIAQVEALTLPQWIETSKRRPEENQQVFICIVQQYTNAPTTYNVSIAYYEGWDFKCDGHALHTPSHWMPLNYPAAPTIPAIPGTKEDAT